MTIGNVMQAGRLYTAPVNLPVGLSTTFTSPY